MSTWKTYGRLTHQSYMDALSSEPLSVYLSRLRDRARLSLDDVAKAGGYAGRSSVQRYFEDETIEEVRPSVARKLAAALHGKGDPPVRVNDLWRLANNGHARGRHGNEIIAQLLQLEANPSELTPVAIEIVRSGQVPVAGPASAGNWMERAPSIDAPLSWLPFPDMITDPEDFYAVQISGTSVNKVAPDGYHALCRKFGEGRQAPPENKFVHVERVKGGLTEWAIKKARWSDGSFMLFPASDDPAHKEPLEFGGDDEVHILGVVVGWFNPA